MSIQNRLLWLAIFCLFSFASWAQEDTNDLLVVGYTMSSYRHDPTQVISSQNIQVSAALFETLVVLGEDGMSIEPGVAESWHVSEDGRTYTFKIRSDARWSDGMPVVAADFVSAWFRAVMPDTSARYARMHWVIDEAAALGFQRITFLKELAKQDRAISLEASLSNWRDLFAVYAKHSVIAVDEHTLRVKLQHPTPHFLHMLINPVFAPSQGELFKEIQNITIDPEGYLWLDDALFSDPSRVSFNGPYRLDRAHEAGEDFYLIANEQYWNRKEVGCKRIRIAMYGSGETAYEDYLAGTLDWVPSLFGSAAARARRDQDADLLVTPQVGTYFYEFNCRPIIDGKPNPLADPTLRRAVAHLFDRRAMAEKASVPVQALGTFIPEGTMPGYSSPAKSVIEHDMDKAKRLLSEAGYEDPSSFGPLVVVVNKESNHVSIVEPFLENLKAVGFEVKVETPDFRTHLERARNGEFHIRRAGWIADFHDPTTFLDIHLPERRTDSGYASRDYLRLYKLIQREQDPAKRLALMTEAEAMLLDEAVVVPIYQYPGYSLHNSERITVSVHPWGYSRFDRVRKHVQ